jgi:parallel beta-helix repeat protein
MPLVPSQEDFNALAARMTAAELRLDALEGATPPPPPPPPPPGDTIGPGLVTFEQLHIHVGETKTILPGTELVRLDVPISEPEHADGGIVNHGTLIAVRGPSDPPIIIRSENPNGIRGHLMSHGVMQLDGVEIRDFGRTRIEPLDPVNNPIARYACHWHLAGEQPTSFVRNCVIHDTVPGFRHGIVLHGTNGVRVENNAIRNKSGAGIYLEDGTERNNLIVGNVCEDIASGGGRADAREWNNERGHEGAGIWIHSGGNEIRGNVMRRCNVGISAYQNWGQGHNFFGVYADNTAEDCGTGFMPWNFFGAQVITVERFRAIRCSEGVYNYNTAEVRYVDFVAQDCSLHGYYGGDYFEGDIEFINPQISGCGVGYYPSPMQHWDNLHVKVTGGRMWNNGTDVLTQILYSSNGGNTIKPRIVTLDGVSLESAIKIARRWEGPLWHNYVQLNRLVWNGRKVFYANQTADNECSVTNQQNIGCPVAGLTNAQALAQYGVCTAGEIAPASAHTEAGIVGLVDG